MSKRCDTAIVGGGAAGMMAAIAAAERGERVALFEKGPRLGRKIVISGNGRCNITNLAAADPRHYHGETPAFAQPALAHFSLQETLAFFARLGVEVREEKRGRLFPRSNQARAVVEVLEDRMQWLGVEVHTGAEVKRLARRDGGFAVELRGGIGWRAGRVVLASGGVSAPQLGADRGGMDMAAALGHETTKLLPGLVALESDQSYLARMQGVKVWAEVEALLPERARAVDTDDLLIARYGVSGFSVLNLSARLVPHLERGPLELRVNLFPGHSAEQVSQILKRRWQYNPHRTLERSFAGLLNDKLVRHLLAHGGFAGQARVDSLSKATRWHLARALTDWRISVVRPRGFEYAEVTIGGVRTGAINPETLESYLVPGLYFAGEMVDVHGDLGGFNFQWAWSSGALAGRRLGA